MSSYMLVYIMSVLMRSILIISSLNNIQIQSFFSLFLSHLSSLFDLVCKSCLVKHLEDHNTCPDCQIVIHQSHPLNYISYDRTMQDIVYKLVPNLQQSKQLTSQYVNLFPFAPFFLLVTFYR